MLIFIAQTKAMVLGVREIVYLEASALTGVWLEKVEKGNEIWQTTL